MNNCDSFTVRRFVVRMNCDDNTFEIQMRYMNWRKYQWITHLFSHSYSSYLHAVTMCVCIWISQTKTIICAPHDLVGLNGSGIGAIDVFGCRLRLCKSFVFGTTIFALCVCRTWALVSVDVYAKYFMFLFNSSRDAPSLFVYLFLFWLKVNLEFCWNHSHSVGRN